VCLRVERESEEGPLGDSDKGGPQFHRLVRRVRNLIFPYPQMWPRFLLIVGIASLSMIPTCPEASSDSGLASMSPKAGGKTRLLLVRHGER